MGSLSVVRSMLALLGALLLASVTACSGPTDTDAAAPKRYIETAQVSQAAKDRYGEQAQAAYRELETFSLEEWLKPAVLDPQTPPSTAEQLSEGITPRLVRSTVVRWNQQVAAAVAGDRQALEDISLLRLDTLDAPTLSLPPRGDPVVSQSITAGKVSLGEVGTGGLAPLVVSFTQDADLSMRDGRRPYDLSLHKTVEFTVLPVEADAAVASPTPTSGTSPAALPSVTRDPSATWLIYTYSGDITSEHEGSAAGAEPGDEQPEAS